MSDLKFKTAKGLIWGGLSSLIQQLIGLFFGILVARILTPSDYGMVGMLSIFSALAVVLQESGFVFVLTNREKVSSSEYSTIFWFNIVVSIIIYFLLFVSAPLIASFFGKNELISLSRFVFLGFVISSFGVVQNAYLYKEMKVKERSIARITALIIACIIGLGMALSGFHYWGIATQSIVSTFVGTIIIWIYSPFRPQFHFDYTFLREVFQDGIKFAIPNITSVIGENIYSIVLGKFYTIKDVGYYSQANKFNTYGYSFILSMLRNVSQPMLVHLRDDNKDCLNAFRKMVRFTAFVSFPTMFGLALLSPELITLLLTEKWIISSYILRLLCIGGAFTSLGSLFSYYIVSQNQSKIYMRLGVIVSIFKIVMAFFASFGGIYLLALACALFDILYFLLYYFYSKKSLHYSLRMITEDIGALLVVVLIAVLVSYYFTMNMSNIYAIVFSKLLILMGIIIGALHVLNFDIYIESKDLLICKIGKLWKSIS